MVQADSKETSGKKNGSTRPLSAMAEFPQLFQDRTSEAMQTERLQTIASQNISSQKAFQLKKNNQLPPKAGMPGFEDQRPEAIQMAKLQQLANQGIHPPGFLQGRTHVYDRETWLGIQQKPGDVKSLIEPKRMSFQTSVQRVKAEELVAGKPYTYKDAVGYYLKLRLGKHCFATAPGGSITAFKVDESELANVAVASESELTKEKAPPLSSSRIETPASSPIEKPDDFSREEVDAASMDNGGWLVEEATTFEGKLRFLNNVVEMARSIIPKAFNRNVEVGKPDKADYINTAYVCKNELTYAYAADLRRNNILVANNYIHPAALERMYYIIKSTAPNLEAANTELSGVCKDFASICYGLILQNDVSGIYKPELAFMHGHVYVKVDIGGEPFAVDAWLGGAVKPQDEHEKDVSKTHQISEATEFDLSKGVENEQSLKLSYQNAELARLIWYKHENRYREIAAKTWSLGKITHVNRGST